MTVVSMASEECFTRTPRDSSPMDKTQRRGELTQSIDGTIDQYRYLGLKESNNKMDTEHSSERGGSFWMLHGV